MMERNTN